MNINIKKRIAGIEKALKASNNPEIYMIMINYDSDDKLYHISERTMKGGNGISVKSLEEYIFPAGYNSTVIIDLMDCPKYKDGAMFSFVASDIRKQAGIKQESAFSLKINESTYLNTEIEITEYC